MKNWSKEKYSEELFKFNPDLKIISEFIKLREYITVEDKDGIKYCNLAQTFLKSKPTIKSSINKNFAFSVKANKIHNYKYDYSKVEYKYSHLNVVIICPEHGEFMQTYNSHIHYKHGCPICSKSSLNKSWINYNLNKDCTLYLIYCYNSNESFVKIGITSNSVKERFRKDMPYSYETIYEISGNSEYIWNLEKFFHKELSDFQYIPKLDFKGKLECFSSNKIFDIIDSIKLKILEKIIQDKNI